MTATFYGVGVGPGDPELLTLKAARIIQQSPVLCYLVNAQGESQAKHIARDVLSGLPAVEEIPIVMPMAIDRTAANHAYDQGAAAIRQHLSEGRDVVFLCEGDPLFFGSYTYLLERLSSGYRCVSIPGISSVHAAASALGLPLTVQHESFVVMSGRHSEAALNEALSTHDSVVIMKAGSARCKILAALLATGRSSDANYLAYIGRDNQLMVTDVTQLAQEPGPYFSLFVVTKRRVSLPV